MGYMWELIEGTIQSRQHINLLQIDIKMFNTWVILFLSKYIFRFEKVIIRWFTNKYFFAELSKCIHSFQISQVMS
jgi:hypothetical protein